MKEVTLTNGAVVRCRPVPPYVLAPVIMSFEEPSYPFVVVEGAAGSERHPALQGTPEYDAWMLARKEYDKQINLAVMDFDLEYGIVDWKLLGESEFGNRIPESFRVPGIMKRYGIETSDDPFERRMQYIKFALILTPDDDDAVLAVTKSAKPVKDTEVAAAMAPFESEEQLPEA